MNPIEWFREQGTEVKVVLAAGLAMVAFYAVVVVLALVLVVAAVVGSFVVAVGGDAGQPATPVDDPDLDATFAVERAAGELVVTHAGGEAVPAGDLVLVYDHADHDDHVHRETWAAHAGVDPGEPVLEGDAVYVADPGPGDVLEVRYDPDDGEGGLVLRHEVE